MQTIRQQIIDLLREQEFNAREISQVLHIMEKEVYDHLEHIDRTIGRQGLKLVVQPYACLSCGFTLKTAVDGPGPAAVRSAGMDISGWPPTVLGLSDRLVVGNTTPPQ